MTQAGETKRQNFNVTPEQEAQIEWLREALGAASAKEAILRAVSVLSTLKEYPQKGFKVALLKPDEQVELVIPGLQPPTEVQWKYLVERPHPWRRQLYVKGRRLLASIVWQDMLANELSLRHTRCLPGCRSQKSDELRCYSQSDRASLRVQDYRFQGNSSSSISTTGRLVGEVEEVRSSQSQP